MAPKKTTHPEPPEILTESKKKNPVSDNPENTDDTVALPTDAPDVSGNPDISAFKQNLITLGVKYTDGLVSRETFMNDAEMKQIDVLCKLYNTIVYPL